MVLERIIVEIRTVENRTIKYVSLQIVPIIVSVIVC